jgi:hypothetical protein
MCVAFTPEYVTNFNIDWETVTKSGKLDFSLRQTSRAGAEMLR